MDTLDKLAGTSWKGTSELWLDPLGNEATTCDCTLRVESDGVTYTWSHEGKGHRGRVTLTDAGADFQDTFHQREPMRCQRLEGAWGIFQVEGTYGPDSDWGWRIALVHRTPTGQLVLQMTNVAPWGEEARAVRMTCARAD